MDMETMRRPFAVGCCEDLGEGADGLRWVGDAVVEDDDGAGRDFR